jgi:hypothetical protein
MKIGTEWKRKKEEPSLWSGASYLKLHGTCGNEGGPYQKI